VAGVLVIRQQELDPSVGVAVASLALGVAAAGDAAVASDFPGLARGCLRLRAACRLVAAMAVAAVPVAGLAVAAACVGAGEIALAVRLLPEVERLTHMIDRDD
jgi:hypothetical protein